jgi:hypothetical protein
MSGPERYVAATDAAPEDRTYGASVDERDDSRRLAVGAGTPAGPDSVAGDEDSPAPAEVVQAVAKFVEDLVEEAAAPDAGEG